MPAADNTVSKRSQFVTTLDGERHQIDDNTAMIVQRSRRRFNSIDELKAHVGQVSEKNGQNGRGARRATK